MTNSNQFERQLRKLGIEISNKKGTGHKNLLNPAKSQIPSHGGRKQLGTGLMNKIIKDLGLK
jgi:mRNA interferase HicA